MPDSKLTTKEQPVDNSATRPTLEQIMERPDLVIKRCECGDWKAVDNRNCGICIRLLTEG